MAITESKEKIIDFFKKMVREGFCVSNDGNISMKIDEGTLLVTSSGAGKEPLKPEHISIVDIFCEKHEERVKATSELPLHIKIYQKRPDIGAVIHAHAPASISLSLAGISLEECYLPETAIYLGSVPTTEYALPSSDQGALVIEQLVEKTDVIVLKRHGVVTLGVDLDEAYDKLERLEWSANIIVDALRCGPIKPLSVSRIQEIIHLRKRFNIPGRVYYKALNC